MHSVSEIAHETTFNRGGSSKGERKTVVNRFPPGGHDESGRPTGHRGPQVDFGQAGELPEVKEGVVRPMSYRTGRAGHLAAVFDEVIIDCDIPGFPFFRPAALTRRKISIDQRGEITDSDGTLRAMAVVGELAIEARSPHAKGKVHALSTGPTFTLALGNL